MPVPAHMSLAECFVIRRKGTNKFIYGKGVNHEPTEPHYCLPRLFRRKTSAKAFLSQWARGELYKNNCGDIVVTPNTRRDKTTMEILPITLVLEPSV